MEKLKEPKSKKNYSAERTKLALSFYDELIDLVAKYKDKLDPMEIMGGFEVAKMTYNKALLWKELFKTLF